MILPRLRAVWLLKGILLFLDIGEADLDRCLASEKINIDRNGLSLGVDVRDKTFRIFPGAGNDDDHVVLLKINKILLLRSAFDLAAADSERSHLIRCKRNGLASRSHKSGDTAGVSDDIPGVVIHDHINKNISGEHLLLGLLCDAVLRLLDILHRNADLKNFIFKAYGEKSPDGKRFIKSKEISEAFAQTEAYSQLFMELCTNETTMAEFVNGIVPQEAKK